MYTFYVVDIWGTRSTVLVDTVQQGLDFCYEEGRTYYKIENPEGQVIFDPTQDKDLLL